MRIIGMVTVASLLCVLCVFAQETEQSAEAAPEPAPVKAVAPAKHQGDIITLKSGKVLRDFQILRLFLGNYEVEILEGIVLKIPKTEVLSVVRDDFEPIASRRLEAKQVSKTPNVIPARKVSSELDAKLTSDISKFLPANGDSELIKVLEVLRTELGVDIIIDKSISEIPEPLRQWKLSIKQGTTLMSFLQNNVLKKFPQVEIEYQLNKIAVRVKKMPTKPPEGIPAPNASSAGAKE